MGCTLEKIEILSFGKLKQVVLEPSGGLQVLTAPNESGKSTVAAFLRFLFYGFPDSRKKELTENDKKLYTPWDSPVSEGSAILQKDGVRYRVFRSVQGTKETCTVTNADTGRALSETEEVGKLFFGVSEEVFSRTLFYKQLTMPQSKDGVMAEQLQNIAVSAEEQVSSRHAEELLTKAKNDLKGRAGNGKIPRLERESIRLENEYRSAVEDHKALETLRAEQDAQRLRLSENGAQTEKVKKELQNIACFEAAGQLHRLNRIGAEAEQAEQAYLDAKAISGSADAREVSRAAALHAAYVNAVSNTERAKQDTLCEETVPVVPEADEKSSSPGHLPLLLSAGGMVAGVALLFVMWIIGAAVLAVSAVTLAYFLLSSGKKKRAQQAEQAKKRAEAEELLAQQMQARRALDAVYEAAVEAEQKALEALQAALEPYGIAVGPETDQLLRDLEQACHETARLEAAFQYAARSAEIAFEGVDLPALEALAAQAVEPVRERAAVERELRFFEGQSRTLGEQARRTEMQIAAMEAKNSDPGILLSKWQAVQALLSEYRQKLAAYEDALACIREASDQMKQMASPRIGELAGKYFAAATDGKYPSLQVDTRLALEMTDENGISRDCDYLSAGARDTVYLCLRLALIEFLYGSDGVPLVLDDAFGRLDDNRLRSMLGVLALAAEKHQIFLLCCTGREEALLKEAGIAYTSMTLDG